MTRILSSDLLIADVITPLAGNAALAALADKYRLQPGGKIALTREQFDEFSAAIEGFPITITPGGSSANVLTTLSRLLGGDIEAQFLGIIGKSAYSSMIRQSLDKAHVNLLPETLPPGPSPETAVSYIITYPDGQRTIATYPGNARNILKPHLVTEDMVRNSDVLLVQGSLWQKLNHAFADTLLDLRWQHNKELWLTLPTHANFGEEKAGLFPWLIQSANVMLGNEEELSRMYHTDTDNALRCVQAEFRKNVLDKERKRQRREQVAFITRGEKGTAIVTRDDIRYLPIPPDMPKNVINTVGAGDTAFSGFVAGHLKGLPFEAAAQVGMALAGEKLKVNGARLPDPQAALQAAAPHLMNMLQRRV